MANSGVGQFSLNVKSNIRDFYGELEKSKKSMKELTGRQHDLRVNSKDLDALRDKSQRIAAEMRELRQQKSEIKLGTKEVDDAEKAIKDLDLKISSLNRQKLEVETEIQPIRTANVELHKVEQEIDRLNNQKVDIKFSDSIKQAGTAMKGAGDAILKKFNPLSSKLNQMFGMGLINKGVNTATSMISGAVDGAIARVDTLNNSVNSFKNMKFSDSEINKLLGKDGSLSKSIDGLPTSLDEAVSNVQMLSSSTRDLELSQDLFKAVNDGVLTFGGSTQNVSSVVMQLSKAFSSGKIQGGAFNSMLNNNMGPVLEEIAKRLNTDMGGLQEGLSKGTISVKEFQDALIDVDKNGSDSLESLDKSVKEAVKGIKTSISNMRTAVGRGVAELIKTLDEVLENTGFGGISGVLKKVGSTFEKGLKGIAEKIRNNKDVVVSAMNAIQNSLVSFVKFVKKINFVGFFKGIGKGIKSLAGDAKFLFKNIKPLFKLFGGADITAESLGKLIPRLFELGVALKVLGTATKVFGSVTGFLGKFKMPRLPFMKGKKDKGGVLPLNSIGIEDFKKLGLKLAAVAGITANIYLASKALQEVNKIDGDFKGMNLKLALIGEAIGGMGVIVTAVGILAEKNPDVIIGGLAAVALISAELYLATAVLKKVSEIDGDFKGMNLKLALIAEAIGGMSLLVTAVGLIIEKNPAMIANGLVAVALIAGEVYLASKALQEVAKIDGDFGSVQSKIRQIALCIVEIGALAAAVGFLMDTGVGALVLASGLVAILGIVGSLYMVALGINKVASLEINSEQLSVNLEAIQGAIKEMTKITMDQKTLESLGSLINGFLDMGIVGEFVVLAKELEALQKISLSENDAKERIKAIQSVLGELDSGKFWDNIGSIFKKGTKVSEIEKSKEIIQKLVEVAEIMKQLEKAEVNHEEVAKRVDGIQKVLKSLSEELPAAATLTDNLRKNLEESREAIQTLVNISKTIEAFQKIGLDAKGATDPITVIKNVLDKVKSELPGASDVPKDLNKKLEESRKVIQKLVNISRTVEAFQEIKLELGKAIGNVAVIKGILDKIKSNLPAAATIPEDFEKNLEESRIIIQKLVNISKTVRAFQNIELDKEKAVAPIAVIKAVLDGMKSELPAAATMPEGFNNNLEESRIAIQTLVNISRTVEALQKIELNKEKAIGNIKAIQDCANEAVDTTFRSNATNFTQEFSGNLKEALTVFQELVKIGDVLKTLEGKGLDEKKITAEINIIKGAIESISEVATDDITNNLKGMSEALSNIIKELTKNFPPKFNELGKVLAKKLNEGFKKDLNFAKAVKEKLDEIKADSGNTVGKKIAEGMNNAFKNNLSIGKAVSDSIEEALKKDYSTTITVKSVTEKGSSSSKTANANTNTNKTPQLPPSIVPQLPPSIVRGGREVPEAISSKLGASFFDGLGVGNISRTFAGLAQSVANATSNVVNNTYNNQAQHLNVYTQGHQDLTLAANRRFRGI